MLFFCIVTAVQTFALLAPVLLLQPVLPSVTLHVFRVVANAWFCTGALLLELLGIKVVNVVELGDGWNSNGPATVSELVESDTKALLVISNHYCRLDWLFTWVLELRQGWSTRKLIALKAELRRIPGVGWAMQCLRYLFLNRNWASDKETIVRTLTSVARDAPFTLLLFPEGTDCSAERVAASQSFARANGLEEYSHVLQPRTRGFVHITDTLRRTGALRVLWDLTIGYVGFPPGGGGLDFVRGKWPSELHFHVSRHDVSQIPEDGKLAAAWLKDRWAMKEKRLAKFKTSFVPGTTTRPHFDGGKGNFSNFPWKRWLRSGSPIFLVCSVWLVPSLILSSMCVRYLIAAGALLFISAGFGGGLDTMLNPV